MSTTQLTIQPYEWVAKDVNGEYSVHVYGHTQDQPHKFSEQVLVRIEDYQPFCQIELPSRLEGQDIKWNVDALKVYTKWLRSILENDNHAPVKILYREKEKLYHFNNHKKYPFLICYFTTEDAMRHCVKLVGKKGYNIKQLGYIRSRIWETSISSIHRLITDAKIGYGQWFNVDAQAVPEMDKISYCEHEYTASWQTIKAISEEDSKGWTVSPKVAAIDIECYSHNHRAMPSKDLVEDVVFQISYITQRLNHPETRQKYLLVTGECDDIPGATVIRYDHEIKSIDGLTEMIKEDNPAVLTGYNIFGFDFPYMDARLKLYLREWRPCGLIKDEPTDVNIRRWRSGAYGFVTVAPLTAEGRICVDMYPIIRRDYKLDRYTLDFVGHHFLKRGKHDVSAREMFRIYKMREDARQAQDQNKLNEATAEMAKVGAYCLEDSCLCIDLMQKLNTWIMLTELATIVCVTPFQIFTQGQQMRVHNQVYQYSHREGYVIDERPGSPESFKGGSVQEPIPGKYRNVLIFDFASLYPSIIRAFNICYTTLVPPESRISDDMCHILAWDEIDNDKKSSTYGQTFKYKYRFIKQQYYHGILPRMCEHLVNSRKAVRKQIGPLNDAITNEVLNQRQLGLKVSANSIFGTLGVREGRLPMPEGSKSITATGRLLIKMSSEYVEKNYGGEIVYGDTDSIMVNLNLTDPNDCLRWGKKLEEELTALFPDPLVMEFEATYAIALFISKKRYAAVPLRVIKLQSGDRITRVPFDDKHKLPNTNLYKMEIYRDKREKVEYLMIPAAAELASNELPLNKQITITVSEEGKPTYENGTIVPVVGGVPVDVGGKPDPNNVNKKGIILARRDNCLWLRETYMEILLSIMFDKSLEHIMSIIDREIERMMTRQVPFHKMLVTKTIGSNYKPNSTYPLKIFMDELRKQGHIVQAGDRLDYVFVCDAQGRDKQGYKMRLPEMYWANSSQEPLDYVHYIEKMLKNPVEQIFYLGYKQQIDAVQEKCTPTKKKRGKVYTYLSKEYINTKVKLIRQKQDLIYEMNYYRPHFSSQEPHFTYNLVM